jgi:hypothetical protein
MRPRLFVLGGRPSADARAIASDASRDRPAWLTTTVSTERTSSGPTERGRSVASCDSEIPSRPPSRREICSNAPRSNAFSRFW